jgi:hypothetical protein
MPMVIENISYTIREKEKDNGVSSLDELMEEINIDIDTAVLAKEKVGLYDKETSRGELLEVWAVELSTNYTVQGLSRIMEYYGLSRRKLRKDEMVQTIVMYEDNPENWELVEKRRRLWENIEELAQDSYLSKYVSF